MSTNTFSGLSEKTLGPGPTGELLALTAQELPAKRTVRGPASDRHSLTEHLLFMACVASNW